jgi:hypothetical protein
MQYLSPYFLCVTYAVRAIFTPLCGNLHGLYALSVNNFLCSLYNILTTFYFSLHLQYFHEN